MREQIVPLEEYEGLPSDALLVRELNVVLLPFEGSRILGDQQDAYHNRQQATALRTRPGERVKVLLVGKT